MDTVGVDAEQGEVLAVAESAWARLLGLATVTDVADAAIALALEVTRSSVAFLAVADDLGDGTRIFTASSDPAYALPAEELDRVFGATSAPSGRRATAGWTNVTAAGTPTIRSTCVQPLHGGGRLLGTFGVASAAGYSATQTRAFAVLANQVAAALAVAQLSDRRKEMVDTLVNLRAELDRSERRRLVTEERARSAERVERAHEAAVDALLAVSRHARSGFGLGEFYRRLTRSIADLVGADKVLFWKLDGDNMLVPIKGAFGVDDDFLAQLYPAPCAEDRDDPASRVVFHDLMFRVSAGDGSSDFRYVLDALKVTSAIAVPWRAGDQRLGLVAAYDSKRSEGFSREDAWVLQKAGLAAGLVWQLRYAQSDLKKTTERLQKIDAARQILLTNVSTAVDKAHKRFAGELHDDALQKLTAAELQLQRLQNPNGDAPALLAEAQALLSETEEALRRLLFEVRPLALEVAGGFVETVRERVRMLKSLTGAEVELEMDLPEDLTYEYRSMLFRQITEAIANIEKHAAATRVTLSLKQLDGGIHGVVHDNGRGFVVAERNHVPGHLGLLGLHERALLAGGWNNVSSEPGLGTTVEFWMPLSDARA